MNFRRCISCFTVRYQHLATNYRRLEDAWQLRTYRYITYICFAYMCITYT